MMEDRYAELRAKGMGEKDASSAGVCAAFAEGTSVASSTSTAAASKVDRDVAASFDAVDVNAGMTDVVVRVGTSAHVSCTGMKDFSYTWRVRRGVLSVTQEARHEHVHSWGEAVVTVPRGASFKRADCQN